ncbi:MAG: NAD(P)H-hydrate dehydratase [Hydrogenophilaceae bacterium]
MQRTLDPDEIQAWLKPRPHASHKGDFGNVGIIGGAPGMAGAALLAGRAALLLGAGRVYVGLLDDRLAADSAAPELMLTTPDRVLDLASPGCLVIGPGLGLAAAARGWLEPALATPLPLLLDADALNQIAADPALADRVRQRGAATLLTPHPGEAGRLLGRSASTVQADRAAALGELVQRYDAGVLLKGAGSLIGFPGRPVWRNTTGNPGMAAPGMGDVLAGMIAALVARGLEMAQAAVLGAHLHGAAGDRAVQDGLGPDGLAASEVARTARTLLNELIYRVP